MKKIAYNFVVTSTILASEVASLFFKDIFRLHGLPRIIISERDSKFTNSFWKTLYGMVATNLNMRTRYHPIPMVKLRDLINCLKDPSTTMSQDIIKLGPHGST